MLIHFRQSLSFDQTVMYRALLLAHLHPFGILTWVSKIVVHLKCVLFSFFWWNKICV
jgi:hypothetical protein